MADQTSEQTAARGIEVARALETTLEGLSSQRELVDVAAERLRELANTVMNQERELDTAREAGRQLLVSMEETARAKAELAEKTAALERYRRIVPDLRTQVQRLVEALNQEGRQTG